MDRWIAGWRNQLSIWCAPEGLFYFKGASVNRRGGFPLLTFTRVSFPDGLASEQSSSAGSSKSEEPGHSP